MKQQGKFLLFSRDEFKEWLFKNKFSRQIRLIQNHHTYIPDYTTFKGNNYFEMLASMERSHIARNFSEIGQNITIFPDGLIAICRTFEKDPAGIYGANTSAIAIENIGNFDTEAMTAEQSKSIIYVNAALCMRFNLVVNTNVIVYHHWFDLNTGKRTNGTGCTKTCPGVKFFGGNTVESSNKNFIPLIINQINALKNLQVQQVKLIEVIVLASMLNCRKGPGTTYPVLKKFKRGDKLTVIGDPLNGWGKLDINGAPGYVSMQYVNKILGGK